MNNFSYNDLELIHNCLLEKRISLLTDISTARTDNDNDNDNDNDKDMEKIKELEDEYSKVTKVFMKISMKVNDVCELEKERDKHEQENKRNADVIKAFHDV